MPFDLSLCEPAILTEAPQSVTLMDVYQPLAMPLLSRRGRNSPASLAPPRPIT
jgi:hypothetical protein